MSPQTCAIAGELESAAHRLTRLARTVTAEAWRHQPAPGSWSAHECVDHLNLMTEAVLPRLRTALAAAGRVRSAQPAAHRRDWMGWLAGRAMTPGGGMKMTTLDAFRPSGSAPADAVLARFACLQTELLDLVRDADGAALDAVRVRSPYDERVRYTLSSGLLLLSRHQHRHLLQAERAAHACPGARSAVAL